ncbi:hypothetical protein BU14_2797s0002, partial [Porphyra umbilicalis]
MVAAASPALRQAARLAFVPPPFVFAGRRLRRPPPPSAARHARALVTTTRAAMAPPPPHPPLTPAHYVDASTAARLDERLMATPGADGAAADAAAAAGPACAFPLPALMELAGQAVAHAAAAAHPDRSTRVAVLAGPGNNGGDGLVAARHLALLGYTSVVVVYPVRRERPPFVGLVAQLTATGVPLVDALPPAGAVDLIIDALFGFSFVPPVRDPFVRLLTDVRRRQVEGGRVVDGAVDAPPPPAVLAVDVPSGWDVDGGEAPAQRADGGGADDDTPPAVANNPSGRDALISLSAPKRGARRWVGAHYVGGRFVPRALADALGIALVDYPADATIVRVDGGGGAG